MRGFNLKQHRADGPQRLGDFVSRRRSSLGLTRDQVQENGGPSRDRVSAVEHARHDGYDRSTLTNLARALQWTPESIEQIIRGGKPTPLPGTEETGTNEHAVPHAPENDPERQPSEDALYQMMLSMGRLYGRSVIMNLAARVVEELAKEANE